MRKTVRLWPILVANVLLFEDRELIESVQEMAFGSCGMPTVRLIPRKPSVGGLKNVRGILRTRRGRRIQS